MQYRADPLSRYQLRQYAQEIRTLLRLNDELYFPIPYILEIFPELIGDSGFYTEFVEENYFEPGKHAEYDVEENCVRINENVYSNAVAGNGRDRMTIMHELAHVLLIKICGIKLSRSFENVTIPPYADPEWQAKCLAAEFLIPAHLILKMNEYEIAEQCGVSLEAATYQLSKIKK